MDRRDEKQPQKGKTKKIYLLPTNLSGITSNPAAPLISSA